MIIIQVRAAPIGICGIANYSRNQVRGTFRGAHLGYAKSAVDMARALSHPMYLWSGPVSSAPLNQGGEPVTHRVRERPRQATQGRMGIQFFPVLRMNDIDTRVTHIK